MASTGELARPSHLARTRIQDDEMNCEDRLESQIGFLVEVDKRKQVFRQAWVMDRSRLDNDADHSWHLASNPVENATCQEATE